MGSPEPLNDYDRALADFSADFAPTTEGTRVTGTFVFHDGHWWYAGKAAPSPVTGEHQHSMWECGRMHHVGSEHWMDEPCSLAPDSPDRCRFEPFRNTRLDLRPSPVTEGAEYRVIDNPNPEPGYETMIVRGGAEGTGLLDAAGLAAILNEWASDPAEPVIGGKWDLGSEWDRAQIDRLLSLLKPFVQPEGPAAGELDAAWREDEAALPEGDGWKLHSIWHPLADDPAVRYEARFERSIHDWHTPTSYVGRGPTPAGALRALARRLSEVSEP